jgi:6-pyruvoyl-tetrahydropterin synthase
MINGIIDFKSVKKVNDPYTKKLDHYKVVVGNKIFNVPISEGNTDYAEIKQQVDAGELTIEDAD